MGQAVKTVRFAFFQRYIAAKTTDFQGKSLLKDENPGRFYVRDCQWGTKKMDLRF